MKPKSRLNFPLRRKELGTTYNRPEYGSPIGGGMEATIFPLAGTGLVHKVYKSPWVTRNYLMGGSLKWISEKAFSLIRDSLNVRDAQPPKIGRHGFAIVPPKEWEKITLIFVNHSMDVVRTARSLGIPTLKKFRPAFIRRKNGGFWVLEMEDLRKNNAEVIAGNELADFNGKTPVANFSELMDSMKENEEKLFKKGFHYDDKHRFHGGWLIRINRETRRGEIFLFDATNFIYNPP